jgi:peptidoglycan/xylan/chitin deacetylase (PgdA/CDA1 family)
MTIGIRKRAKDAIGRVAGLTGCYARRFRSQMTVVAFHRVTDELVADGLTCSPAKFEAFCKFFAKHFRVLALSEQLRICRAAGDLGGTLSITFDDGYLDNIENAVPILRALHLPATFFVTTGFIGTQTVPPWDRDLPRHPGWMTWDHVRKLRDLGFEIGNHTETHIDMGTADSETVRNELARSKRKMLDELGAEPHLFAYPFGGREHISTRSRNLIREAGFSCCLSCYGGVNASRPDPFELKRIGIAEWFASPNQFGYELLTRQA